MTISTAAALAAVYGAAGCVAAALAAPRLHRSRAVLWAPVVAIAAGACQGVLVGGVFSFIVAEIYLSIPYALDLSVAVALGLGLAALLLYGALGRHHAPSMTPHASEYYAD